MCPGRRRLEPMGRRRAEPNADMWATEDESARRILDLYRRVTAFRRDDRAAPARRPGDRAVVAHSRDRPPHPPRAHGRRDGAARGAPRHPAREQLDGALGLLPSVPNLPDVDTAWWDAYVTRLRAIAERIRDRRVAGHGSHHPRPAARGVDDQDDHWADRPAVRQRFGGTTTMGRRGADAHRGTTLLDRHGHSDRRPHALPLVGVWHEAFAFCTGPDERSAATSRPTRRWR